MAAVPSAQQAVQARLSAIAAEVAKGHPRLYRQLALYLQVLRDQLLPAVHQACFHLATQVHPRRYGALPSSRRQQLQRRLAALVRQCSSLLTVEHLALLAGELDQERLVQRQDRQQRLIQALEQRQQAGKPLAPPQGSVNLGLDLPIGGALVDGQQLAALLPETLDLLRPPEPEGELAEARHPDGPAEQGMEAVMEAFNDVMDSLMAELEPGAATASTTLLPADPLLLLRWLLGYEQALLRRLRNLSHAINVELLRHGICSGLLPMPLLEAVLQGKLEVQSAPANLVRLPLPLQAEAGGGMEVHAVLLRPTDLELELPPLRTCRRRLRQSLEEVRTMAKEAARLQRRLASLEAEALWLQDIKAASNPRP